MTATIRTLITMALAIGLSGTAAADLRLTSMGNTDGEHRWRIVNNGTEDRAVSLKVLGSGEQHYIVRAGETRIAEGAEGTAILRDALTGMQVDVKASGPQPYDSDFAERPLRNVERGEFDDLSGAVGGHAGELAGHAERLSVHDDAIQANAAGVAANRAAIDGLASDVDDLRAGVAGAYAAASHQYDARHQGLQLSLAGGAYDSEEAVSVGGALALGPRVMVNASVTHDSRSEEAYGAGVLFKF